MLKTYFSFLSEQFQLCDKITADTFPSLIKHANISLTLITIVFHMSLIVLYSVTSLHLYFNFDK